MTNQPTDKPAARRRWPRIVLITAGSILAALLLVFLVFLFLYYQGQRSLPGQGNISAPTSLVDDSADDGHRVVYQGQTYVYNENVVGLLFLGVDKENIQQNSGYGSNGQADSLFVAAIDTKTGVMRILPLSRETMVDVDTYSSGGAFSGIKNTQLCLAYAYGKTGKESSENVMRSVSRLLYGIQLDGFVAIDLEGVSALTDAIGGVPLTPAEGVQGYYPEIINGQTVATYIDIPAGQPITLNGRMAQMFIRSRGQDVDANNRRIQRQKQFLSAFYQQAASRLRSNFALLPSLYNTAKPYIVSSLDLSQITYLAGQILTAGARELQYISIEGETVSGGEYVEFHASGSSLYEAVLEAFYSKESN